MYLSDINILRQRS